MYGLMVSAHAYLIDNGDGTITQIRDDGSSLMWLKDANYAYTSGYDLDDGMGWKEAMTWAEQLNYGGYNDWRLPTALNGDGSGPCEGSNCSGSEMGNLYYIEGVTLSTPGLFSFANVDNSSSIWWSSTEKNLDPCSGQYTHAWDFDFAFGFGGSQYADTKGWTFYAWAVRDGDSASVPEPATLLLVGSGLAGLGLLGRKKFMRRDG